MITQSETLSSWQSWSGAGQKKHAILTMRHLIVCWIIRINHDKSLFELVKSVAVASCYRYATWAIGSMNPDSAKSGHFPQTPDATSVTMIYPHGHGLLGLLPYLILIENHSKFDKIDGLFSPNWMFWLIVQPISSGWRILRLANEARGRIRFWELQIGLRSRGGAPCASATCIKIWQRIQDVWDVWDV